jgi:hypothetical protein
MPSDGPLKTLFKTVGIPVKASYARSEVCRILDISPRTFWTMVSKYEPDSETGLPIDPATLDSYKLRGHRRVTFSELEAFFIRNRSYDRDCLGR